MDFSEKERMTDLLTKQLSAYIAAELVDRWCSVSFLLWAVSSPGFSQEPWEVGKSSFGVRALSVIQLTWSCFAQGPSLEEEEERQFWG